MAQTDIANLFFASPCVCCGSDKATIQYPIDKIYASTISGKDLNDLELGVAICPICSHEFIQPTPSPEYLAAFYANYMSQAKCGFYKERSTDQIPTRFRIRYEPYLARLKLLHGPHRCTLVDIGAGLGMFLRLAKEHGFEVLGVEPNGETAIAVQKKYNIPVINNFFEQAEINENVDIITMWDLLEHLAYPRKALEKSASILKSGGKLVIELPARDSFLHKFSKLLFKCSGKRVRRPLYSVCGIHHLHYFSQEGISSLLRQCGFQIIEIHRGETDLESLCRGGRIYGRNIINSAYNLVLYAMFLMARLFKQQNKLIVFAQKVET